MKNGSSNLLCQPANSPIVVVALAVISRLVCCLQDCFHFGLLALLRVHQEHGEAELRQRAHVQADGDRLRLWKEPRLRGRAGQDQRQAHLQTQLARYRSLRPSFRPAGCVSTRCAPPLNCQTFSVE